MLPKVIRALFITGAALSASITAEAITFTNSEVQPPDLDRLDAAIDLVDDGEALQALATFEELVDKYADNYLINYEYCFALYDLERYEQALPIISELCTSPDATELAFRMEGKILAKLGKTDEALAAYRQGLQRFPYSGDLNLEIGDLLYLQDQDEEALASFNAGISADPEYASNYYCAAKMYLDSSEPVWGLIYAETGTLLNPRSRASHYEMMRLYADCLSSRVGANFDKGAPTTIKGMQLDRDAEYVYVQFPGLYESCELVGIGQLRKHSKHFDASIEQMAALRRAIVETYYRSAGSLYGEAMELMAYQKRIIDAGHWDAYNCYLFAPVRPEEGKQWQRTHLQEYESFVKWMSRNPLQLDYAHTVGANEIFRDYTPMTVIDAMHLQASFAPDAPFCPIATSETTIASF